MAEVSNYAYSLSDKGLWVNLFGSNELNTTLKDGAILRLTQTTSYPWDGAITLNMEQAPARPFSLFVRIPGWCQGATVTINGIAPQTNLPAGTYAELNRSWKAGDKVAISLPMPVVLIEANPLVEENRNQVAVKRGPIVYCLESTDNQTTKLNTIALSTKARFKPTLITIDKADMMALEGNAQLINQDNWSNKLYRAVADKAPVSIPVRLIPYYAWANRGHSEMDVWIPLIR